MNAENGEIIWEIEPESMLSSPPVVADKKVAFGTSNGTLYVVSVSSGKICESVNLAKRGITALALSDGKLFVGQENGRIYCFEGSYSEKSTSIVTGVVIVLLISWLLVAWIWNRRKKVSK